MKEIGKFDVVVLVIAVAGIRLALIGHTLPHHAAQSFQAIAHLLVGGLFAAWWCGPRGKYGWAGYLALVLTIVEIVAATITVLIK